MVYDSKQSETLPIKCGVPQGSILGPLLFICVMDDIGNVSDFLYTILYADDTCVLLNGKRHTDLIALLNSELKKLSLWLRSNKLSLNVQKTYYMVFHRARIKSDEHAVITIDNVILQRTNSLKYLGVIIDTSNLIGHSIYPMLGTRFLKGLASCTEQENICLN